MADDPIPPDPARAPLSQDKLTPPDARRNGSAPLAEPLPGPDAPRHRRTVYESHLLPPRKRRRVSPAIVIPGLLLFCALGIYLLVVLPHQRRFVPTAGQVVFVSDRGTPGQTHLWSVDSAGGPARRLITTPAAGPAPGFRAAPDSETSPAFSSDGSQIAFVSTRGTGTSQVWVVDADGQNLRQATRNSGAKALTAFAPSDNSLIGYTAAGTLSVTTLPGGDTSRLLPAPGTTGPAQSADTAGGAAAPITIPGFAWMPSTDSAHQGLAAVEDNGSLQMLALLPALDAKPRTTVSDAPDSALLPRADTLSVAWSPTGGLLAVAMLGTRGLPNNQQFSGLILLDSQGNPVPRRPLVATPDPAFGPQQPVFSPDGTQIVCEIWRQPDLASRSCRGLFVVPADGSGPPRTLARGDAEDVRFLPDGQSIVFRARRPDHKFDLFRIGLDGKGALRLSDGQENVSALAMSPQQRHS